MQQENLRLKKRPRADYREMSLTVMIFGCMPPHSIYWSHPRAIYQASWMARNLHSIKMFIFAEQLKYDEENVSKLKCLNHFLDLFYIPSWISFTLAAGVPASDL